MPQALHTWTRHPTLWQGWVLVALLLLQGSWGLWHRTVHDVHGLGWKGRNAAVFSEAARELASTTGPNLLASIKGEPNTRSPVDGTAQGRGSAFAAGSIAQALDRAHTESGPLCWLWDALSTVLGPWTGEVMPVAWHGVAVQAQPPATRVQGRAPAIAHARDPPTELTREG